MFYWSPVAMAYVPILLLHLVSLGYLLLHGPRTRQTWLFCGWLGGMTLMVATQCMARVVYIPWVSACLDWWGGVGGVTLAIVALLQFAYHFPRLRYPQEARVVLIISLVITGVLFTWMAWETLSVRPHYIYAMSPPRRDVAFAAPSVWQLYSFERFVFGFVRAGDGSNFWISFRFFDAWQVIGNLWVLAVWVRKTVQFSVAPDNSSLLRRVFTAFRHPQNSEARLSRAWVGMMLLSPIPVLASVLDSINRLPPGMFALVYLLVLGVIMFTYVNYAPEPTSLMVKLVGISLVTLLIVFGVVSDYVLRARQRTYLELRQAELAHLQTLITTDNFTDIPADIVYVAARQVTGLFAEVYQMRFARGNAPTAAQLMAHDALLREGLGQGHFPTLIAVLHENPWLETTTVATLAGNPEAIDQFLIPTDVPLYRNSSAPPVEHLMRYTLIQDKTRYEVGYRYQDYRAALHQEALPFLAIQLATTLLIITVFPRFFRIGLVMPLAKLLEGVERVDHGDLQGNIPVSMEDEIGRLTHGFNQMVNSLYTSEQTLRTLNLALEKRVADRTRDLAMLYKVAALINQPYALDELLTTALHRVISGLKAAAGVIFLADTESESLRLSSVYGVTPSLLSTLSSLPMWPQERKSAHALLIHDLTVDPRISTLFKPENASKSPFPYHTLVSLPIPGQENILGVLVLFAHTPFFFNVEDLEVLNSIASQLGIAIENTRLRECAAASVVLEERQRLARDLHDSVTQVLYSQKLFADAASKSLSGGQVEHTLHYLERLGQSADYALREMRLMIYRLRPSLLASVGLCDALQRRLELVEQRAGICTHFACAIDVDLPAEIEQTLYYIAEEALNNALKHAAATESQIEVVCDDVYITLSVVDNGRGFDRTSVSAGMGLQNLRERVEKVSGKWVIESRPGAGTRVVVRIPLQPYFEEIT